MLYRYLGLSDKVGKDDGLSVGALEGEFEAFAVGLWEGSLDVDGDSYKIIQIHYIQGIVAGIEWSDDDFWRRDREELNEKVNNNF